MPAPTWSTTVIAVKGILDFDPTLDLQPFIDTATQLISDVCLLSGYSDAKLELIHRWLSAHFAAIEDPQAVIETVKDVTAHYDSKVSYGLRQTRYGQQAVRLDTDGSLAALDNSMDKVKMILPVMKGVKRVMWLGKP